MADRVSDRLAGALAQRPGAGYQLEEIQLAFSLDLQVESGAGGPEGRATFAEAREAASAAPEHNQAFLLGFIAQRQVAAGFPADAARTAEHVAGERPETLLKVADALAAAGAEREALGLLTQIAVTREMALQACVVLARLRPGDADDIASVVRGAQADPRSNRQPE